MNGDIQHNEDNSELNERISQLEKENEELKGNSKNKKEQESNDQVKNHAINFIYIYFVEELVVINCFILYKFSTF